MQTIASRAGQWSYVIGPYRKPIATVNPGEIFAVETADAFENKVDSPKADITKLITLPYVNPLTGPIYIAGAEKGDTLALTIHSIEATRSYGVSAIIPEFGGLTWWTYSTQWSPSSPGATCLAPASLILER
jgi:acetamidase/formamidase